MLASPLPLSSGAACAPRQGVTSHPGSSWRAGCSEGTSGGDGRQTQNNGKQAMCSAWKFHSLYTDVRTYVCTHVSPPLVPQLEALGSEMSDLQKEMEVARRMSGYDSVMRGLLHACLRMWLLCVSCVGYWHSKNGPRQCIRRWVEDTRAMLVVTPVHCLSLL